MAQYRIWIKAPKYKEFELPVNPQEVTISYPANPTQYDVEGIGEIIIPRLPKLATVTFEAFFPREQIFNSMINSGSWYTPEWYVSFFKNIQASGVPFELTIVRGYDELPVYSGNEVVSIDDQMYFNTVFDKAVILDFSITDKGGEPGDIYYNISISEYRDASPQSLAEVSKEKVDDDGLVYEQERVILPNRPPQVGDITVDDVVTINGPAYESPDENQDRWEKTKGVISHVESRVSRLLPPKVSKLMHSVYASGLGWVNLKDCQNPDVRSNIYGIKKLVVDNVQ